MAFVFAEIPRAFKDLLGWLLEKGKPVRKRVAFGIFVLFSAWLIWAKGFHTWLVFIATIFWIIGIFMTILLIYNKSKDAIAAKK